MFQSSKGKNPSESFKGIQDPRLALAAAKKELADQDLWENSRSQKIANEVATRPRTWRMDSSSSEYPTMNFEVVHSRDLVGAKSIYKAEVFHVNTIRGKGFRGYASAGGTSDSTQTFIGTSELQYEQALQGALKLLEKFLEESEVFCKKQDEMTRDRHNGNSYKQRLQHLSKNGRRKLGQIRKLSRYE